MAAGVLSLQVSRGLDVWGHTAVSPFSYVGPNPYVTAGEAIAANQFKLGQVEEIPPFLGVNVATTAAVVFQYNCTTGKMQAFWQNEVVASALVEVANGTDLSGYAGRGRAYGKG